VKPHGRKHVEILLGDDGMWELSRVIFIHSKKRPLAKFCVAMMRRRRTKAEIAIFFIDKCE
jgi:hypothetical protein